MEAGIWLPALFNFCHSALHLSIIMAALCNRGAIIFLPCRFFLSIFYLLSSIFYLLFIPRLISAAVDRMSAILLYMAWPLCEFRMQVWNVLHAARCKYRTQKSRQKSPSGHHRTNLTGYIFATKARIDNRKKLVKQQYLLWMSPQYGELRHTSGWDRFVSWGTTANFNGFRILAALLHGTLVVGISQTLRR